MPRRGKRVRIEEGIFRDDQGYEVRVGAGAKGNSRRYRFAGDATEDDLKAMRRWRSRRKAEVAVAPTKARATTDTLRADVPRVLALFPTGDTRNNLEQLLDAWLSTPLAAMRRSDVTREDVKRQLATWGSDGGRSGAGYAASTLNHRLSALRTLYRELDGDEGPTAGIGKFKEPEPEARGVPMEVAEAILVAIKDRGGKKVPVRETRARTRLEVMLFTGIPPAQMKRLQPEHIDWDAPSVLVTARRKGKGASARRVPLLPQAVHALRTFDRLNLYGPFSTDAMRWTWNRARDKVAMTITDDTVRRVVASLRPYDLRHSFLTAVYLKSGDHRATSELGLHADERTTRRYTLAAVGERARLALAAFPGTQPNPVAEQTHPKTQAKRRKRSKARPVARKAGKSKKR